MIFRNVRIEVLEKRPRHLIRICCFLGLIWMILASAPAGQSKEATNEETLSLNEHIKIMDFQIPGWRRQGEPATIPVVKANEMFAVDIDTEFNSGMQRIKVRLVIPKKENVYKIMGEIPLENARQVKVNGFEAIEIVPPSSAYEEYKNLLYVNVAGRYVVFLEGIEIFDPATLITAAKAMDLKKLATLPNELQK